MSWADDLRRLLARLKREPPAEGNEGGVPCHVAAERLFEWLDGEIDDPELAAGVGTHLETCARCYPRLRFERSFREAVRRAAREETTPDDVRARILEALEAEGLERG